MNTKSGFFKAVSIAILLLLGASLTACGKKDEPQKEQYVYNITSERLANEAENMYCLSTEVKGNIINSIMYEYKEDSLALYIRKYDAVSKESEIRKINDSHLSNSGYINYFHVYDDDSFAAIVSIYDEKTMENEYYYSFYSPNGDLVSDSKLELKNNSDMYFYIGSVSFLDDQSAIIQANDSIYKIDKSGKVVKSLEVQNWINSIAVSPSGKIFVSTYLDETGEAICPVKDDFSGLDEKLDISVSNPNIYVADDTKLLISGESTLKLYDITSNTVETVWNWIDIDLDGSMINSISLNKDGTYSVVSEVYDEDFYGIEISVIEKKEAEPGKEKKLIVFGCSSLDSDTKKAIRNFNRNNSEYRITVKCYEEEMDDYEIIMEKMGADLTQGAIDIIDLSYGLDYNKLVNSKALLCLDEYFEKEISKDEYFTNVFDAFKVNGKNYCVAPFVSINTMGISKDYTGGKGSITIDELINIKKQNPDKEMMSYCSKERMFYICLYYTISDFVDYNAGTCSFDNENFYKILEFANTFPSNDDIEYDYDNYDEWAELKNGNVFMTMLYLSDTDEIQLYSSLMKGGLDITGYPVSNGSGHVLNASNKYGIAQKSKAKDAAWEFLKTFLMEDYQQEHKYNGFPVLKSAFDAKMKEAMKVETYIDENGVEQEASHGSWGNGFTTVELYALTQEQADLIKSIYESATTSSQYDDTMIEMIDEEVGSYFAGQKSAQDVAKIIQDRVKIYLAESR